MRQIVLLSALALLAAPVAQAQRQQGTTSVTRTMRSWTGEQPWNELDPAATIPVVISASGGISLGSYQAGVTWALVRFLRATNDPALDSIREQDYTLPRMSLVAATGASAGNINALMAAIEWCADTPRAPEESLFWRTWINIGWAQLFPPASARDTSDHGIFDRSVFRRSLFPEISERMRTAHARPECARFPVGVTATRLVPDTFPLNGQLTAHTQRFASLLDLARQPDGALRFEQPRKELRQRSMGALLALATGRTAVIPDELAFRLIEASSAFPVAFAPRTLTYYDGTRLDRDAARDGWCPPSIDGLGCLRPDTAAFTDGGVFDNNPLSLALEIHRRIDRPGPDQPPIPRALYVGTDDYRPPFEPRRRVTDPAAPPRGLDAIFQLVGGMLPSAREYEMQTLARMLAREEAPVDFIRVTERMMPLYGEHLHAFGAFLGRPFREYDFYVGLYDGLYFVAHDILCAPARTAAVQAGDTRERCTKRELEGLIAGRWMTLGPVAPFVLRDLLERELGRSSLLAEPPAGHPAASEPHRGRLVVLRALVQTNIRQMSRPQLPCTQPDWAARLLCANHLDSLLRDSWHSNPQAQATMRAWAAREHCELMSLDFARMCLADSPMIELLDKPNVTVKRRVRSILDRAWRVEETVRHENPSMWSGLWSSTGGRFKPDDERRPAKPGSREYSSWVELAEFLLRSADGRSRRGRDFDPSSIPPELPVDFSRAMYALTPYMLSFGGGIGHWSVDRSYEASWRPMVHLGSRWAVELPLTIAHARVYAPGDTMTTGRGTFRLGPGLVAKFGSFFLTDVAVAARPTFARHHPALWGPQISYELSTGLLLGKVRLSAQRVPPYYRRPGGSPVSASVGVADIPGIIYWIAK